MEPTVIDSRFELLSLAGEGGMGRVYRALDHESKRFVALKMVDDGKDEQLRAEAAIVRTLHHAAIVEHVGHGKTSGGAYLAMQWIDGEDLKSRLRRGSLDAEATVQVATRVAGALAHLHHRGLVHRDVKPGNLQLAGNALDGATLIDFGLARRWGRAEKDTVAGTPGFMAPEQIRGDDIGAAADVFGLGCTMFRCLTGVGPFKAADVTAVLGRALHDEPTPLADLAPATPASLVELIDATLAKDPVRRPSADDMLETLGQIRVSLAAPATPARAVLGARELRIVSIIVAGGDGVVDDEATLLRSRAPSDVDVKALTGIATRFGATLNLLPNGALLAVLEAGGAATDVAVRAVRCALALELRLPHLPMAIATGRAELGPWFGGEAIDRAATLGARTARGVIAMDSITADLLDARFEVARDDGAHRLIGERAVDVAPRVVLGRRTVSVGRANDAARVMDAFERCREHESAHAMLVVGPPGIGKSRLRHEIVSDLCGEAEVWLARADSTTSGSPFDLVAPMLRAVIGITASDSVAAARAKLERAIADRVSQSRKVSWPLPIRSDVPRMCTFLAEILALPPLASGDVQLAAARRDPVLYVDQIRRAFCELLALELARKPLVLVVEDAHWADPPSVALLGEALRRLANTPFFVLLLSRPEGSERFAAWPDATKSTLVLSPLPAWASLKLVRQVRPDIDAASADALVARAQGNPYYLEELMRAHAEGRMNETPSTVMAMAQARLESVPAAGRRLLRAAAIIGARFSEGDLLTLVGHEMSRTEVSEALRALEAHELVVRRNEELSFRHALVREAAYAMLTDEDRVRGHRAVAEALSTLERPDALVLADHFERGGEPKRAAALYVKAARSALDSNDFSGALERGRAAERCGVEGGDVGQLRAVQAMAQRYLGDVRAGVQTAREALALLPGESSAWFEALTVIAVGCSVTGSVDETVQLVEGLFERGMSPRVAEVATLLTDVLLNLGRRDDAARILDRLAASPALLEDPVCRARIFYATSTLVLTEDPTRACDLMTKSIVALEEAGNLRSASGARMHFGYMLMTLGQNARAEAILRSAGTMRAALGMTRLVVDHNLGIALARLGRLDEALAVEEQATATASGTGSAMFEGFCRVYLSKIRRMRRELDVAEREARGSVQLLAKTPPGLAAACAELACVLLERDEHQEALEVARRGMAIRAEIGAMQEGEVLLQTVYAEALAKCGFLEEAREQKREVRERVERRAAAIDDPDARRMFLQHVPENVRAMSLAFPK